MRQYFFNPSKKQKYVVACIDAVMIILSIIISYCLRVYLNTGEVSTEVIWEKIKLGHALIVPVHMLTLYVFNLYALKRVTEPFPMAIKIGINIIFASMLISGGLFFFPKYVFGRQVLLIHIIVLSFLLTLSRWAVLNLLGVFEKEKKVALVCSSKIAKTFIKELSSPELMGYRISHIVYTEGENNCGILNLSQKNITVCSSIDDLLKNNQFDILGFDSSNVTFSSREIQLILKTRQKNKGVYDIPNLYKSLTGKIPLDYVDGRWLLSREDFQGVVSKIYLQVKRLFDMGFSFFLLTLFAPVFIIISIAIKMESKGKVIFSQERLGLNRNPFICYKFRTMVQNAEALSGPVWANDGDSRITRVGRFLRKTRLDELPQLWNILKGDISFVGPRPIRKYFADKLSKKIPFYELRFSVQPGLSGWAQVSHDYAGSEDGQLEKFQYELFYIQNMSLLLDIITVFKTVQSVLKGEGK